MTDSKNEEYLQINQQAWDQRTPVHFSSKFYDVEGFLKGEITLNPIELAQLGDVTGMSMLHLQCHFGLDSLSWVRKGAKVSGVDLSPKAIEKARELAAQTGLGADFFQEDVIRFGDSHDQTYDLVFSSYGVLCWLPNLDLWAQTIYKFLNPGGSFHLIEFHPVQDLLQGYDYFPKPEPDIETESSYTENSLNEAKVVTWAHSLGELFQAILRSGLTIESFEEFPFSPYNCFPGLEEVSGQGFQKKYLNRQIPLVFSIKATKQPLKKSAY